MVAASKRVDAAGNETVLAAAVDVHKEFARRRAFPGGREIVHAVNGVSLEIETGMTLGLVGESGCGKSTLGRLFLGLMPPTSGTVFFEDRDLSRLERAGMKDVRRGIQAIFQDPLGSLNPFMSVADILDEPLRIHNVGSRSANGARIRQLLELVGLPESSLRRRPSEFSGGQQQRIAIARSLVLNPRLLVADEALSALDVSIQAQIVNLFLDVQRELGLSYLFISHNLKIVRHIAQHVAVMYLGKVVELGPAEAIYRHPRHPYTLALLSAVPVPDPPVERRRRRIALQGDPPSPTNIPTGCPFRTRCWKVQPRCETEVPALENGGPQPDHRVACHFPE